MVAMVPIHFNFLYQFYYHLSDEIALKINWLSINWCIIISFIFFVWPIYTVRYKSLWFSLCMISYKLPCATPTTIWGHTKYSYCCLERFPQEWFSNKQHLTFNNEQLYEYNGRLIWAEYVTMETLSSDSLWYFSMHDFLPEPRTSGVMKWTPNWPGGQRYSLCLWCGSNLVFKALRTLRCPQNNSSPVQS